MNDLSGYVVIDNSIISSIATTLKNKLGLSSITPTEFTSNIEQLMNTDQLLSYAETVSNLDLDMLGLSKITGGVFAIRSNILQISGSIINTIGDNVFYSCSNLTSINLPNCEYIGDCVFMYCNKLASISPMPNCSYIGYRAFYDCRSLSYINLPNCEYIGSDAFHAWYSLSSISIPNCSYIGNSAFYQCSNLSSIDIPNVSYIGGNAFYYCSKLESIYVLSTSIPSLYNAGVFYNTPLSNSTYLGYFGSIYVLSSLVDSFKTATNWSYYSSRIVAYTP